MNAVITKVEGILKAPYSTENYLAFLQELFEGMQIKSPDVLFNRTGTFTSYIEGHRDVGKYTDPDGKKLILLAVQLKKANYVENSRNMQRAYAKRLIENAGADAAIVAFYMEDDPKWRLSFVRLGYEMKFEHGRLKTQENLTPARRYSFLVGQDEPCHTAIERFGRYLDGTVDRPTLDDLEEAFSVEAVTNEFFSQYCDKFMQLRNFLEQSEDFKIEAEAHNFTSEQFAKKLMGQIVFLYFLQKKGWLGVNALPDAMDAAEFKRASFRRGSRSREVLPKVYFLGEDGLYHLQATAVRQLSAEDDLILSESVKGKPWGTGPRNFMRRLFQDCTRKGKNFYDDYLEPLFYDALNVNRRNQNFYDATLHCRIPFLSGGLFEPLAGYNWQYNRFNIPNELFSNRRNDGDREADGILDVFDRYNFTMSEDEPLEREVAIDPEMLGKVFENLLDVSERKGKGAFYTPREIVHYMCQESLINYLTRTLNVSEAAIRDFILMGDFMSSEDTSPTKRRQNGGMYISEELFVVRDEPDNKVTVLVNRLGEMDDALRTIRVVDPAVGSGAFPLGMLNEIVKARTTITNYICIPMDYATRRTIHLADRSTHRLKLDAIRDSIFAADIEPSAVDIARLRLWLSLVIDDELVDDPIYGHIDPLPLPNLECNIVCGNSLLDELDGIKLINQSKLLGTEQRGAQIDFLEDSFNATVRKLIEKQQELFSCEDTDKKQQLLEQIESLRDAIIRQQLQGASPETMAHYEEARAAASKPYVLWQLEFARVFCEKGGFDVCMGNPPYIQLQKTINEETGEKLGDQYEGLGFESFTKTGDIYCLFYEKGLRLLHDGGVLSFITSNKWMRAGYGEKLRSLFAEKTNPLALIDFAGHKIFESATVDVNILTFTKEPNCGKTEACIIKEKCTGYLSVYVRQHGVCMALNHSNAWIIYSHVEAEIKRKIESVGTPLREWGISINFGIKTGYNDAFIITTVQRDALVAEDPKSADIIRPILRGRDIQRFGYTYANLWLINVHNGVKEQGIPPIDISDYPAIKAHLDQFYEKLVKRADKGATPYNLRNCAYLNDFCKPKIIWKRIGSKIRFSYDSSGILCLDSTCFATGEDVAYLVAVLNSMMGNYLLKESPKTGTGDLIISVQALEPVRIPKLSTEEQKPYEELLMRILERITCGDDYTVLEQELDKLVFDAYGLTEEEREYVSNYVSGSYR